MKLAQLFFSLASLLGAPACADKKSTHADIVVLIGTDRPQNNTTQVAEQLCNAYTKAGLSAQLFNVTDFGSEFYAPTAYAHKPAPFQDFNKAVLGAQYIVFVTPEYNAMIPAPLARVINLLSYPDSFQDKKFIIASLSVSPWGGARAHAELKTILTNLHGIVDDSLDLTIPEAQNMTKNGSLYTEHAEKIASNLQK